MTVKASYVKKDINPFILHYAPDDHYYKELEIDDDTDIEWLRQCAKESTRKGYRFIKLEVKEERYWKEQ